MSEQLTLALDPGDTADYGHKPGEWVSYQLTEEQAIAQQQGAVAGQASEPFAVPAHVTQVFGEDTLALQAFPPNAPAITVEKCLPTDPASPEPGHWFTAEDREIPSPPK